MGNRVDTTEYPDLLKYFSEGEKAIQAIDDICFDTQQP